MRFFLGEGFAYAVDGGRTIFMDVRRGRYFTVPWRCDQAFQDLLRQGALTPDRLDLLEPLVRQGALTRSGTTSLREPRPEPAARDWLPRHRGADRRLIARCLVAQLKAGVLVSRGDLGTIVSFTRARQRQDFPATADDRARDWDLVVASYEAFQPFRSRSNQCLADAVAFLDVASSRGLHAKLVFGITSTPFAAHCWVQNGDCVMNDSFEVIRNFTPILAI